MLIRIKRLIHITFFVALFSEFSIAKDNSNIFIDNIVFVGVKNFDENEILKVMRIKEARFLSKMDFDRRLVKLDAINIKTFYVSKGFLGVQVKDSLDFEDDRVNVFYRINEGQRYYLRKISINGNNKFDDKTILKTLGLKLNRFYNPIKTNIRRNNVEEKYLNKGKLFSTLKITDSISDSVDINIDIQEGPNVYLRNSSFIGLGKIDTNIVKRELRFTKGDLYNNSVIRQSQRQLLQTGIFSVATITPLNIIDNDSLVDLAIELRKYKQYEWISEGGYYPIEYYEGTEPEPGAGVLVEWKNRSVRNTATSLSLKLSGQTLISNNSLNPKLRFDISIANPWLYKLRIPTKSQIYLEAFRDYISLGAPYVTRYGIELVNTYFLDQIERRSYIETRLYLDRFSRKDYLNIDGSTLNKSSGRTIKVEKHTFEINFRLDKSDNVLYPKNGFVYTGQVSGNGGILGGNRDFVKLDLGIKGFKPIYNDIIFATQFKFGTIKGWRDEYIDYVYDKFYLGGSNTLRGWDILKYQTDENDQPVGDINRILNNYEIRFPLFWLLGGEIFADGGHIFNDYQNLSLIDIKWNGGFGLTLSTPLGPVRLDIAKPFESDLGWNVHLGVQYIF